MCVCVSFVAITIVCVCVCPRAEHRCPGRGQAAAQPEVKAAGIPSANNRVQKGHPSPSIVPLNLQGALLLLQQQAT